jgi:hypothetical protein
MSWFKNTEQIFHCIPIIWKVIHNTSFGKLAVPDDKDTCSLLMIFSIFLILFLKRRLKQHAFNSFFLS